MTLRKSAISKCTVLVSLVLFFAAALTGCRGNDPGSDLGVYKEASRAALPTDIVPADLQGVWDSGFDEFTITGNTLTYNDGGWGMAYGGTVVHHHVFTGNVGLDLPLGVMIIQYTDAPSGANVGRYMPVYYAHRPGDDSFDELDFGNAYDMEAQQNAMGLYPPVNELSLPTAKFKATTSGYMDRYFVGGLWRGGVFAPYYKD